MNKGQNTRGLWQDTCPADIHREYILVGGQNEERGWVPAPRRGEYREVSGVG